MALGIANLAFIDHTSLPSVIPSSSRDMPCRISGPGARLVCSSVIIRNSSSRGNRLFVTSPFMLMESSLRARVTEKISYILGGQGNGHTSLMTITRNGPAAAEGSNSVLDADSDGENEFEEEDMIFRLSGDDTEVKEIGGSTYSVRTLKKLVFRIGDGSKQFVMDSVGGAIGIFKKEKQQRPELVAFESSNYESKDGKTALRQWTATELTMQHNQLVRIATDLNYLVFAFAFFGWVRVLEAVLAAFSTHPAKLRKLMQASNAMDPLTVAWLAYNLRKPILGILQVNPTDFQQLASLKGKLWEELHAFFERQWKVMATLAVVRFLGLVASNVPASQWITSKLKALWDVMMMLPIF